MREKIPAAINLRSYAERGRVTLGVLPIWKRVHRLSVAEFRDCPVWAYVTRFSSVTVPDDDSTIYLVGERLIEFVKPLPGVFSLDNQREYVVATEFRLADGSRHVGFSSPWDSSRLECARPVIITDKGLVRLWYQWLPSWPEPGRSLERLGRTEQEVFPLEITALIPGQQGPYSAIVEGISGKHFSSSWKTPYTGKRPQKRIETYQRFD